MFVAVVEESVKQESDGEVQLAVVVVAIKNE